jgi:thymidylate synthase (FAD)
MKLIEPKVELIQQAPGLVGMYKHIEKCARTCYKSEDKITEDSYKKMYDNLVQRGHLAMLEHGTVYLKDTSWNISPLEKYKDNKFSKYNNECLGKEEIEDGNDYSVYYKYAHYLK